MTGSHPRPRRWIATTALAVGLAIAGLALLLAGAGTSVPTPLASGPPTPTATAGPVEPVEVREGAATRTVMAASPPSRVRIPSIGVESPVNEVGLNPDRSMEVPAPGPDYDQAAWYRGSVTPGEIGPSVIIGHVDSAKDGPSVFYRLGDLRPGAAFTVNREDGKELTFRVDSVRSYSKSEFPTRTVYGGTTRPEVRLITCGGDFDSDAGSYRDNTVVFAHLVD